MQKTPWFRVGQADVILNYLPLKKCTNLEYKSYGKKIKICQTLLHPHLVIVSLSLSLSLSLPRRLGPIKAGLMCPLSLTPFILRVSPWILLRLDPAIMSLKQYKI